MSGTFDSNAIIISDSDEDQEVMAMDSQHRDSQKATFLPHVVPFPVPEGTIWTVSKIERATQPATITTVPMRTIQQKVLMLLIVLCALVTVANQSHFHVCVWDAPILVSH